MKKFNLFILKKLVACLAVPLIIINSSLASADDTNCEATPKKLAEDFKSYVKSDREIEMSCSIPNVDVLGNEMYKQCVELKKSARERVLQVAEDAKANCRFIRDLEKRADCTERGPGSCFNASGYIGRNITQRMQELETERARMNEELAKKLSKAAMYHSLLQQKYLETGGKTELPKAPKVESANPANTSTPQSPETGQAASPTDTDNESKITRSENPNSSPPPIGMPTQGPAAKANYYRMLNAFNNDNIGQINKYMTAMNRYRAGEVDKSIAIARNALIALESALRLGTGDAGTKSEIEKTKKILNTIDPEYRKSGGILMASQTQFENSSAGISAKSEVEAKSAEGADRKTKNGKNTQTAIKVDKKTTAQIKLAKTQGKQDEKNPSQSTSASKASESYVNFKSGSRAGYNYAGNKSGKTEEIKNPSDSLMESVTSAYLEANATQDPAAVTGIDENLQTALQKISSELDDLNKQGGGEVEPTLGAASGPGVLSESSKTLFYRIRSYFLAHQRRLYFETPVFR